MPKKEAHHINKRRSKEQQMKGEKRERSTYRLQRRRQCNNNYGFCLSWVSRNLFYHYLQQSPLGHFCAFYLVFVPQEYIPNISPKSYCSELRYTFDGLKVVILGALLPKYLGVKMRLQNRMRRYSWNILQWLIFINFLLFISLTRFLLQQHKSYLRGHS